MATLIFGAGASYGSGGCSPTPPLGKDLFKHLNERGGAFSRLDNEIKSIFESNTFETGMSLISNDSRLINPLQKELACYLSNFHVDMDNAYVRLFNKLHSVIHRLNIVTLNYDMLIEEALSIQHLGVDYNGQGNGINLLKLHGSSNFLPCASTDSYEISNVFVGGMSSFFENLRIEPAASYDEILRWCNDERNNSLSPILALYTKGKRVVINKGMIDKIQADFANKVDKSSLVVLVGIEYVEHDAHVWKPIQESKADILIVNPFPSATLEWANKIGTNKVTVLEKSFDDSVWEITKYVRSYCL